MPMPSDAARGLYSIIDVDSARRLDLSVVEYAKALIAARPALVQLRDKHGAPRDTLALLREIVPFARAASVPIFHNDRPDLARVSGCDGVHLGQEDVPVEVARAIGVQQVGVSTHNQAELDRALEEPGLAYIALGPVFQTGSKANPDPHLGLAGLVTLAKRARAKRPDTPLVAIGGLDPREHSDVLDIVDLMAVIGAHVAGVSSVADVARRAEKLVAVTKERRT